MFLPAFVSLSVSNITDSLTVYGSLLIDCQHQYDMCDVWAFDGHQSLADERSPAKVPGWPRVARQSFTVLSTFLTSNRL